MKRSYDINYFIGTKMDGKMGFLEGGMPQAKGIATLKRNPNWLIVYSDK